VGLTGRLKVYCAGALRGDSSFLRSYGEIVDCVRQAGHEALSELGSTDPALPGDGEIWERDTGWLRESDCLIAEVSGPSLGVGYEIGYGLHHLRIPVLCLRHEGSGRLSAMIRGNRDPLLVLKEYSESAGLRTAVLAFLSGLARR
jgi:hypothetical protein